MKDILIIFTILLLLLIVISTLGGSLSFIGKGQNEYYTNAARPKQAHPDAHPAHAHAENFSNTQKIPKPFVTKQAFTQAAPPAATATPPLTLTAKTPAAKAAIAVANASSSPAPDTAPASDIEGFEGPMYATA